jgi:hypothetical protein
MVRGVQHAPPEDPDARPPHVEERHDLQPPRLVTHGHEAETWQGEPLERGWGRKESSSAENSSQTDATLFVSDA